MDKSESIEHIAKAMNKAQANIVPAKKTKKNPYFKSNYADIADVMDAFKKPAVDNGLSYSQFPISDENGNAGVETILMHESGEWISEKFYIPNKKDDPQSYGSLITYVRRYALASIFGVATEDDDANYASRAQNGDRYNGISSQQTSVSSDWVNSQTDITKLSEKFNVVTDDKIRSLIYSRIEELKGNGKN